MTTPLPALRDFSDRLSPMVVKEMRQGLRTRFFTAALIVFHVMMGFLMLAYLTDQNADNANEVFWVVAIVTLLGVMPAQAFHALNGEARDGTLDMLRLTGTSSFRIVWGKWFSIYSQILLVAGSLLPYLIARYFMGNAEIVPEMIGIVLLVAAAAVFTAGVVAFSSQASLWVRLLSNAALGGAAFLIGLFVFYLCSGSEGQQMLSSWLTLDLWEKGLFVLSVPGFSAYGVYLFVSLGASRIADAAEEHSSKKRGVALIVMTLLCGCGIALAIENGIEGGMWCLIPMFIICLIVGMDLTTEAMPVYPSVIQGVWDRFPRLKGIQNWFYPGWASGVILWLVLALETMAVSIATTLSTSYSDGEMCAVFFCLLTAVLVPVCVHGDQEQRFARWWVVQTIAILAMVLTGAAGAATRGALSVIGFLTPLTGLTAASFVRGSGDSGLWGAAFISAIWMLGAIVKALSEMPTYATLENEAKRLSQSSLTHA
jgi:hypothetical protein